MRDGAALALSPPRTAFGLFIAHDSLAVALLQVSTANACTDRQESITVHIRFPSSLKVQKGAKLLSSQ